MTSSTVKRHTVPRLRAPETEAAAPGGDTPPWLAIVGLYVALALLAGALIGACFLAAWLVAGHAV